LNHLVDMKDAMKNRGSEIFKWWDFHHDWTPDSGDVIEEITLTIYVNGVEFVSLMGTPLNQDWLAVGFLMNEGIIESQAEIGDIRITPNGCCIDVWLNRNVDLPQKMVLTSGCGGGLTREDFRSRIDPIPGGICTEPGMILKAFTNLQTKDSLYARARGVHAAGLLDLDSGKLLQVAEDIGRHNTIDKLHGACLLKGFQMKGRGLITTGRISSEMLRKGAFMGCPIIASRTSPTSAAVDLARKWNITLVGYARHGKLRVYCNPERLGFKPGAKS
jgi:FdhD protein